MTIKYYIKDAANIAVESSASLDEDNCMENEMADKLDILMEILFKYIHEVTHINGKLSRIIFNTQNNFLRMISSNYTANTLQSRQLRYLDVLLAIHTLRYFPDSKRAVKSDSEASRKVNR